MFVFATLHLQQTYPLNELCRFILITDKAKDTKEMGSTIEVTVESVYYNERMGTKKAFPFVLQSHKTR